MSKVWFVTGSSRGLGRCFVEAALSRGDKVAATARSVASLDDLVDTHGDAVLPLEMDVTDKAGVAEAVQRAVRRLARAPGAVAGKQPAGDPVAAAQALLKLVDAENPPLRALRGQGFYPMIKQAYADRLQMWEDWQALSAEAHGNLAQA